jgi:hypothetical protein
MREETHRIDSSARWHKDKAKRQYAERAVEVDERNGRPYGWITTFKQTRSELSFSDQSQGTLYNRVFSKKEREVFKLFQSPR